ncbi:MAG: hypothetical protein HETSPECPRED_004582 [Heterodermia speciosa]|uniref:Uncharacterized protein n=1 Tax=Heterodermia speciosa TaxID=116794 RepID=A0A8H3FBD9_9LECA|nr:MAG: hypothetical protein HETSPECPRED_004582 [Heterodermia speciosa]
MRLSLLPTHLLLLCLPLSALPTLPAPNTTLSLPPFPLPTPQIPTPFTIAPHPSPSLPLSPLSVSISAIALLSYIITKSPDGRLPQEIIIYNHPHYRDLTIVVTGKRLGERLLLEYFLWGMALIMDHMVRHKAFFDASYDLRWERNVVGVIQFLHGGSHRQLSAGNSSRFHVQDSDAADGDDGGRIKYEYTFGRDEEVMTSGDIAMASIAALLELASRPASQRWDTLAARFPRCSSYVLWRNRQVGSAAGLSREVLTDAVYAAAGFGLESGDYHPLSVVARWEGREVARGGYFEGPRG